MNADKKIRPIYVYLRPSLQMWTAVSHKRTVQIKEIEEQVNPSQHHNVL